MHYDELYDDIALDCPGIPVPIMLRGIREAARIFCRESTAYRSALTSDNLTYSNGVYSIQVPPGSQIETVISPMVFEGSYSVYTFSNGTTTYTSTIAIALAGYSLSDTHYYSIKATSVKGASPEWLDCHQPGWRSDNASDSVSYFVMTANNSFVLTPDNGLDRSAYLTVSLVLMPSRSCRTLDNDFGNRWFEYLVAGAKYYCLLTPGAEWENPSLAQYYKTQFDTGIQEAKNYVRTGYRNPQADGLSHVRLHYK